MRLEPFLLLARERERGIMAKKTTKAKKNPAQVCVVMGSDSDLEALSPCMDMLESFGIAYEVYVASAHRTHDYLKRIITKFDREGGSVVIAAAGAAAHLPGVVAALTTLPVIGVPMSSKIMGIDSLLSIVQMPSGMPVATVAIGGAKNAGLLAAQILATSDKKLREKYDAFRKKQADGVIAKSKKLQQKGYRHYFDK